MKKFLKKIGKWFNIGNNQEIEEKEIKKKKDKQIDYVKLIIIIFFIIGIIGLIISLNVTELWIFE